MSDHVVLDAAVAVVHDLGASQVIVALSDDQDGSSRIVASRGGREVPADVYQRATASDRLQTVPAAPESWTVTSFPMSARVRGALVVRQIDGGEALTEHVLQGFGRLIGLGLDRCADLNTGPQSTALSREVFSQELAAVLDVEDAGPWTVVSCDLNNFHLVNEFLGFQQGTILLRTVAERLLEVLPDGALVARASADHFLLAVPPQVGRRSAAALVAWLDDVLRQPVQVGGTAVRPSATFGSAVHGGTRSDTSAAAEALIVDADHDLRLNKDRRVGRQHVEGSLDALWLDAAMHAALAADQIVANFQPIYDLATGDLSGFEALARWTTADGRTVPPSAFIPIAEGNGLIHSLGERILDDVGRLVGRSAREPQIVVHVNVSATQLASPGYAARFVRRFSHDVNVLRRLVVEVTESKQIVDHDAVALELQHLRRAGVGVALDDFGTGSSTLSQLHTIPATQMKIDKLFVHQAVLGGTAVLEAMISLARAFGLSVVAEGVETVDQLRMVERLGCDRVQGYLFSGAVPMGAISPVPRSISAVLDDM